ncbi:hypothetical protein LI177_08060 [bacterium 210820-DFI.6.37]|nr:hypothetical protein [bacterium 210820-DFI.6.37]
MTNHDTLYVEVEKNLAARGPGRFRLTDLCNNPPARLGRRFRDDVVIHKKFPDVRRVTADRQSIIYEKFNSMDADCRDGAQSKAMTERVNL